VAALGPRQLRALAFRAAAVLMAIAAQGRKHGGAVDVAWRRFSRRGRGFGAWAWTLLRQSASDRQHESESRERRAFGKDRCPHRECGRTARNPPGRLFSYCLSASTNRARVFSTMFLKVSPHSAENSSDTSLPQPAGTAMYCLPPAM